MSRLCRFPANKSLIIHKKTAGGRILHSLEKKPKVSYDRFTVNVQDGMYVSKADMAYFKLLFDICLGKLSKLQKPSDNMAALWTYAQTRVLLNTGQEYQSFGRNVGKPVRVLIKAD